MSRKLVIQPPPREPQNHWAAVVARDLGITDQCFIDLLDFAAIPPRNGQRREHYVRTTFAWQKVKYWAKRAVKYGVNMNNLRGGATFANLLYNLETNVWKVRDHSLVGDFVLEYRDMVVLCLKEAIQHAKYHNRPQPPVKFRKAKKVPEIIPELKVRWTTPLVSYPDQDPPHTTIDNQ